MIIIYFIVVLLLFFSFLFFKRNIYIYIPLLFFLFVLSISFTIYLEKNTNIHFPFLLYLYSLANNSDKATRRVLLLSDNDLNNYQKIFCFMSEYPYELISQKIPKNKLVLNYSQFNRGELHGLNKEDKILIVCCAGYNSYMQMEYMRMLGYKNVWYSGLDGVLLNENYYVDIKRVIHHKYKKIFNFDFEPISNYTIFNNLQVYNVSSNYNLSYYNDYIDVGKFVYSFRQNGIDNIVEEMPDRTSNYLLFGKTAKFFIKDIREKTSNNNIVYSEVYFLGLGDDFIKKYFNESIYLRNININIEKYEKNNDYKNLLVYLDKIINIELAARSINYKILNELYYKKYTLYKKFGESKKASELLKELINKNIADQYIVYLSETPQNKIISREKFYKLKDCYDKAAGLSSRKALKQYKSILKTGFYERQIYKKIAKEYVEIGNNKKALIFISKYLNQRDIAGSDLIEANIIKYKVFLNNMTNYDVFNPYSYFFESNYIDDSKVRDAILMEILKTNDFKKRLLLINLFIETADHYKKTLLRDQLFLTKLCLLNDMKSYEDVIKLIDKSNKQEYGVEYTRAFVGLLNKLFKEKEYAKIINIIDKKIGFFDPVFLDDINSILLNVFKSDISPEFIVKYYDILINNSYLKETMLLPEFTNSYSKSVIRMIDFGLTSESNNNVFLLFDNFLEKKYLTNDLRYQIYIRQYFYYKDIVKDKKKATNTASAALQTFPNDEYLLFLKGNFYRKTLNVKEQKHKDVIVKRAKIKEDKKDIRGAIKLYKKALFVDDSDREIYKNIIRLTIQDNSILYNERILNIWLDKNLIDEIFDFYPYDIKLQILYDKHNIYEFKKLIADLANNEKFIDNKEQIDNWYYYLYRDLLKSDIKVIKYINKYRNNMKYDLIYRKKLSFGDEYLINKLRLKLNMTNNLKYKIKYVNEILKIDQTNDDMGLLLANLYFKNKEYAKALRISNDFISFLEQYKIYKSPFYINNMYVYKAINDCDQIGNMKKILLGKKNFIEPLSDSQIKFIKSY